MANVPARHQARVWMASATYRVTAANWLAPLKTRGLLDIRMPPIRVAHCKTQYAEDWLDACSDGKDNDSNGYADCNGYSCSQSEGQDVIEYSESILAVTFESCTGIY
jgi:hypothetical protein